MAYDLYEGLTEDIIYNQIMNRVHSGCRNNRGNAFSFTCTPGSLSISFIEHYQLYNSKTWKLCSETADQQAAAVLNRIKAATQRLPHGITAEIIKNIDDPRESLHFDRADAGVFVRYMIKVNVQAIYAQPFFSQLYDGNLIHDPHIDYDFRKAAYDFYSRIREQHIEPVDRLAKDIDESYQYLTSGNYELDVRPSYIQILDKKSLSFSDYGMGELPGMVQAYGLAMFLIERLTNNTICKNLYELTYNTFYISVRYRPISINKPKLTAW